LRGLMPVCAWCRKIRDDNGYWHKIERYIESHSNMKFTHGICPQCMKEMEEKNTDDKEKKTDFEDPQGNFPLY